MTEVTFVKLCVVEPSQPFITEVRGPFHAEIWDSIVESFQEGDPEEIASWELPENTIEVWCVIEAEGSGHYEDPRFWYLIPVRPLQVETFLAEEIAP